MAISTEAFYALSHEQKREYMNRVVAERDAEIAKLRAELDAKDRTIQGFADLIGALNKQLAAARAALKVEREACDEYLYRCQDVRCVEDPGDKQCPLCAATSARRAAEAKGEPK